MTDPKNCRCPVRPYASPGSLASGSATEDRALARWQEEHGTHPYSRARDMLAGALQSAEREVGNGEAVLDMVADVFNQPRMDDRLPRHGGTYKERAPDDSADTMRAYDWSKVPVTELPNVLMNYFGQDCRYGYDHPVVTQALFRVREALARVSNALAERQPRASAGAAPVTTSLDGHTSLCEEECCLPK